MTSRLIVAAVSTAVSVVVVAAVFGLLRRGVRHRDRLRSTVERVHWPTQLLSVFVVVRLTAPPLLSSEARAVLLQLLAVLIVIAVAWFAAAALLSIEDIALSRFPTDVADNLAARRLHTQVALIRRVTVAVICVLTAGAVLTTFPRARAAGASVLASAGLVGVVAALAAQSMLGNLLAGLHLAFGDSLRLDDVVVVEGEWGRVEEITLSYVVVRIWDDRRLILPTSYFTSTPFQNWTRTSSSVLGTVELDVDWTVPLESTRAQGRHLVENSSLWDRRAYGLQLTDATGGSVRVRVLVSAADSSALWDLRCLVREQMVVWLQEHHPSALPLGRTRLDTSPLVPSALSTTDGPRPREASR